MVLHSKYTHLRVVGFRLAGYLLVAKIDVFGRRNHLTHLTGSKNK